MKVRRTISVVYRELETAEERFKRVTLVKMNVKNCILMNPEYDVVDLFMETDYSSGEVPEGMLVIGRL